MSRPLLLFFAVVLAGIAAWVVLAPTPDDPGAAAEEAVAAGPAVPAAGALEPAVPRPAAPAEAEPPAITRTQVEETSAPAASGPQVLPSLADGAGIRVVVVDEADAAVAGAEVLVVDSGRMDEFALQQALARTRDVGAVLEELGERYRTRADGSVVIPHAEQMLAVAARSGRLSVFQLPAVPDGDKVLTLKLKPGRALTVTVLDEAGAAVADAPVAVTILQGSRSQSLLGGTTGVDGSAVIDNLELLDNVPFRGDTAVALAMLLAEPVSEDVDLREPPEHGVELRKPPTGTLRVELLDRDGAPAGAGAQVVAQVVPDGEDPEFQRWGRDGHAELAGSDGCALYRHVGLGLRLTVEARSPLDGQVWRGVVDGPAAAGAQAVLRLQPDSSAPVIVFQVVDESGAPLPAAVMRGTLLQESGQNRSGNTSQLRADGEGRVRYAFDEPPQPDSRRTLDLVLVRADDRMARLDLSGNLAPGDNDYGVVVLAQAPLVAAGTVLGPDGRPATGAELRVARKQFWGPEQDDNFYWDTLWNIEARSDGEGGFTLRGLCDAQELQVTASLDGMQPVSVECANGAAGLVLRLLEGGEVGGRVLLDDAIDREAVSVNLDSKDGERQGSSWQHDLDGEGRFSWESLPSGRYDLVIRSAQGGEDLHRVEGVQVTAGAATDDPRLARIDLRGKLSCFTLEFRDPAGRDVEQVQLFDRERELSWWAWNGEVTIVTLHPALDLDVQADGYRTLRLEGVREDRTVELRAGLALRLTLDQPGAVPTGWQVSVFLSPRAPDDEAVRHSGHRGGKSVFDARGEALLLAPGPGAYDVTLMLGRGGGRSSWGFGGTQQVEVVEAGGEQRAMLKLDVAALEATKARMIENEGGR